MATVAEKLLSIEEYAELPDPGYPTELVRGRIVAMQSPGSRHGQVCSMVAIIIGNFADEQDLGHVLINDSGVVTERDPDSVRGPDVAYYSYARVPRGPLPDGYLAVPPDLVFEVMSPSDLWTKILGKVHEYLEASVVLVCVVVPKTSKVHFFRPDADVQVLGPGDEWSAPEVFGEFRVPVRRFFE